jgi:hypothetical protein
MAGGQAVSLNNGRFTLTYQNDGNLVLYDVDGSAVWDAFSHLPVR